MTKGLFCSSYDPRKPHMDAIERILIYLKSTPTKGILFSKQWSLEGRRRRWRETQKKGV